MKQFKRIIDRQGRVRYYIEGKQVKTKRGASEYIKRNFDKVRPENLSKQERITYLNKQRAIKAAATIRKTAETRMRFKGRFLNKGLQNFLDLVKFLPQGERNISREFPDVRNYGDLLKEIQRMYGQNLAKGISLDETEWITPNLKRKRTEFENITDIVESLQNDFPSYQLNVILPDGTRITNYIKAVEAVMKWERAKIEKFSKDIAKLAYVKFTHFGSIDIFDEIVTIDLNRSTAEPRTS